MQGSSRRRSGRRRARENGTGDENGRRIIVENHVFIRLPFVIFCRKVMRGWRSPVTKVREEYLGLPVVGPRRPPLSLTSTMYGPFLRVGPSRKLPVFLLHTRLYVQENAFQKLPMYLASVEI